MQKGQKNAVKTNGKTAKSVKGVTAVKAVKTPQKATQTATTPYREGSSYQTIIVALKGLGVGKFHAWDKIIGAVELPSGFKSKEKRNDNGLNWKGRVMQNVRVLARADYGKACRDILKLEVRTNGKDGAGLFRLGK